MRRELVVAEQPAADAKLNPTASDFEPGEATHRSDRG